VRAETITSDNLAGVEWDENYFKFCNFADFYIEGRLISSDFNWCSFSKIEWYWGLFTGCNFIYCTFTDCTFAGTSFGDSRFVDCTLVDCTFKKDNLGGDCDFSGAIVYGCSVKNSMGFHPDAGILL
jgi:uncharacterized protein YjbI with pentapeptide repeats